MSNKAFLLYFHRFFWIIKPKIKSYNASMALYFGCIVQPTALMGPNVLALIGILPQCPGPRVIRTG